MGRGGQCLLAAEFEFSSQTSDSEVTHTPEAETGTMGCVAGRRLLCKVVCVVERIVMMLNEPKGGEKEVGPLKIRWI